MMELALKDSMCNDKDISLSPVLAKPNSDVPNSSLDVPQGCTIATDLTITGTKIFADASWRNSNIPGRSNIQGAGVQGTCIGIFLQVMEGDENCIIMIQASMDLTPSPLVAEAGALHLAAAAASKLQIERATFLTDNLTLAKQPLEETLQDLWFGGISECILQASCATPSRLLQTSSTSLESSMELLTIVLITL